MKQRNLLVIFPLILLIFSSFSLNIETTEASDIEERLSNYNKIKNRVGHETIDGLNILIYCPSTDLKSGFGFSTLKMNFDQNPNNNVTIVDQHSFNISSQLLKENPDIFFMVPGTYEISSYNLSIIKTWFNSGEKLIWLGGDSDFGAFTTMDITANPILESLESDLRFSTVGIEQPYSNDLSPYRVLVNETGVSSPFTDYVTSGFVQLVMHGPTAITYIDGQNKFKNLRNTSLDNFENEINIILNSTPHAIALDQDFSMDFSSINNNACVECNNSDIYAYDSIKGNYPMLVTQTMNTSSDESLIVTSGESIFSNYKNMNGFITEKTQLEHNGSLIINKIIVYFFNNILKKSFNTNFIRPTDQQFTMNDTSTFELYYDIDPLLYMSTNEHSIYGYTHKDGLYFYLKKYNDHITGRSQSLILLQTQQVHTATSLSDEFDWRFILKDQDIKFTNGFHPNFGLLFSTGGSSDDYLAGVNVVGIENEFSTFEYLENFEEKFFKTWKYIFPSSDTKVSIQKLFLPWEILGGNSFEDLISNNGGTIKAAGLQFDDQSLISTTPYNPNNNTFIESYYTYSPYFDYTGYGLKLISNSTIINPITSISTTSTTETNTTSSTSYTTTHTGPETVTETKTQTQIINQTIIIKEINNNTITDTLTVFSQNPQIPILEFTQTISIFIMYVAVKKLKNISSFEMKPY